MKYNSLIHTSTYMYSLAAFLDFFNNRSLAEA